jgi:SAM-dependent methyltransferase
MTTDHPVAHTDRQVLTTEAYADNSRLAARLSIYDWQRPRLDLVGLALSRLGATTGPVLDVGWGVGNYTGRLRAERPGLRVVPVDLAAGMLPEVVGEVDRLPFASGSAGAALAMHMLYYATDPRDALAELRRVLRPGGRLVVSTNAADDKREMGDLWRASLRDLGLADQPAYPYQDRRFSLDVAIDLIGQVFGAYDVHHHRSEIAVPDPDVVLAYVDSTKDTARLLPAGLTWSHYLTAAGRRIRAEIDRVGTFRLTGHVGILTATA